MEKLLEQMFDFEVFPNWWCCVLGKYPQEGNVPESIKDDFLVITSDMPNAKNELLMAVQDRRYVNMGYNIKRYDNIILNAVACGLTPQQIKIVNDLIIRPESEYDSIEHMRLAPFAHKRYTNFIYQDMLDDNVGSLKDKETCMQLDIRETTVPFDKEDLTDEDKDAIIFYCKHDVWASMKFYQVVLKPFIATKLLVAKVFNIPIDVCYKSTNANLSVQALKAVKTRFPDATRTDIVIPKELKNYITYSLPADVVNRLVTSPAKFDVYLYGNVVSFSNGGDHSIPGRYEIDKKGKKVLMPYNNVIAETNDEWVLVNADGTSFYPAQMIKWHTLSRAVTHPEIFAEMFQARVDFKKVIEPFEDKYGKNVQDAPAEEYKHYKYCKDTSQAYKLILNTTFGASGNQYLALYDPYMTTTVCRLGQLLIASFGNNVYNQVGKENVRILQTNTDGILFYIRRSYIDMLHKVGDEFTKATGIMLEYEEEKKIYQRDVNNYIMIKHSGREKSKGGFFVTDMIQPGYNRVRPLDRYVCREAVKGWLLNRESIIEHIANERDLSKFVITCSKGSFSGIVREFNDGREDEVLNKCNRAYASKDASLGRIMKLKKFKGEIRKYKCPSCPEHCGLLNAAIDKYDFDEVSKTIDYNWYIEQTYEMLSDQWYELNGVDLIPIDILKDLK